MAGYPGLPGYRPKVTQKMPVVSLGGRQQPKATTKPAGQGKVDPSTGLPKMPSEHEMRAEANANAWKSILQMQQALPSQGDLLLRYGQQRAAVAPLIDAHRDWLEKAGEYQVGMTNAISGMVKGTAAAGDTSAAATSAAAGAPLGARSGSETVSPAGAAMPVAAYGTSFANYLHSLVPYASAIGGQALGQINTNENTDMQSLNASRKEIALKLPELQQANYTDINNAALNNYKSELAALVAGHKSDLDAAKFTHTVAKDTATAGTAARNATTAEGRLTLAIKAQKDKAKKDAAGGASAFTAGDASGLRAALKEADKRYNDPGGHNAPGRYSATLTLKQPTVPGVPHGPGETKIISGSSLAEVRAMIKKFLASNNKASSSPLPQGKWSQSTVVAPVKGSTVTVDKPGEYNRRMEAWRYLVVQNGALLHPLTESDLRERFRQMVGAPK